MLNESTNFCMKSALFNLSYKLDSFAHLLLPKIDLSNLKLVQAKSLNVEHHKHLFAIQSLEMNRIYWVLVFVSLCLSLWNNCNGLEGRETGDFDDLEDEKHGNNRIIGGDYIKAGDFPAYVGLKLGNYSISAVCNGALIGKDIVVTAAHCVFNRTADMGELRVAASIEHPANWTRRGVNDTKAIKICVAPDFVYDVRKGGANDYAILRLANDLTADGKAQIAKLPRRRYRRSKTAYIVGVGYEGLSKWTNDNAAKVKAMKVKKTKCQDFNITSHICFKGYHKNTTMCGGKFLLLLLRH